MGFYRGFLFCWNCGFDDRWVIRMTFAHTVSLKHAPRGHSLPSITSLAMNGRILRLLHQYMLCYVCVKVAGVEKKSGFYLPTSNFLKMYYYLLTIQFSHFACEGLWRVARVGEDICVTSREHLIHSSYRTAPMGAVTLF